MTNLKKSFVQQFYVSQDQAAMTIAVAQLPETLQEAITILEDRILKDARIITKNMSECDAYAHLTDVFDLHWLLTLILNGRGRFCRFTFDAGSFRQALSVCVRMAHTLDTIDWSKPARQKRGVAMLTVAKQLTLKAEHRPRNPYAYERVITSIRLNRQIARLNTWVADRDRKQSAGTDVVNVPGIATLLIGTVMNPQALLGILTIMMFEGYESLAHRIKSSGNHVSWRLLDLAMNCFLTEGSSTDGRLIIPDAEALKVFYRYIQSRPGFVRMLIHEGKRRGVAYVPDGYDVCGKYLD